MKEQESISQQHQLGALVVRVLLPGERRLGRQPECGAGFPCCSTFPLWSVSCDPREGVPTHSCWGPHSGLFSLGLGTGRRGTAPPPAALRGK